MYAVPLHYRKTFTPLYEHRPPVIINNPPEQLCASLGYDYVSSQNYDNLDAAPDTPILVCGAGIIPQDIISTHTVINSHPGYIPLVRGLDAFKWAVVEDKPIGVTTHIIGPEVDAGQIIGRKIIPVYKNDTFHAAARRVYENEIIMLADSLRHYTEEHEYIPAGTNELHRRMPAETEREILPAFDGYVKRRGIERLSLNMSRVYDNWNFDVVGISTIDYPVDNTIILMHSEDSHKLANLEGLRQCVIIASEDVKPGKKTCLHNFFIHTKNPDAKLTELLAMA